MLGAGCSEPDADPPCTNDYGSGTDHGSVLMEFSPAANAAQDPLTGTATVGVTLAYGQCLLDFYSANPAWAQAGIEGMGVFERFSADLCEQPGLVCSDAEPQQTPDGLSVEFVIAPDALQDGLLAVGPLPTEDVTGCVPIVRMVPTGAEGRDARGDRLWETLTFDPGVATTEQCQPISVRAQSVTD